MNEDYTNQIFLELRRNILKLTKKLNTSDNDFLKEFSKYLKETYKDVKRTMIPDVDWRMEMLDDFIGHIYILLIAHKKYYNGCAMLGKTPFDKLDFTRSLLENYGG